MQRLAPGRRCEVVLDDLLAAVGDVTTCTPTVVEQMHRFFEPALEKENMGVVTKPRASRRPGSQNIENCVLVETSKPGRSGRSAKTNGTKTLAARLGPGASAIAQQCLKTIATLVAASSSLKTGGCKQSNDPTSSAASSGRPLPCSAGPVVGQRSLERKIKDKTCRAELSTSISKINDRRIGRVPDIDHVELLTDCFESALAVLFAIEGEIDVTLFDMERMACKFASRLVELHKVGII
ncbi:hypothetical protein DFJ77DRAFT_149329 [Powellomyces hirtus]|nr:hypothetical protein DFJ77DRAFT_149329 [Powellomyces hirtus]